MGMVKLSPLAPESFANLCDIDGVRLATGACGIKYQDRDDLLVVEFAPGTEVAGVFTKSQTASVNIVMGREAIKQGLARVLVVCAGNANAFNGVAGASCYGRVVENCSKLWNCPQDQVFFSATGVIGEVLPHDLLNKNIELLQNNIGQANFEQAANAIRTTDTFAKGVYREVEINGEMVKISAIVKGSGMIAPNMATMLSYIFTDAKISAQDLQSILDKYVEKSFNAITIDSDCSTSDTVLLFATGKSAEVGPKNMEQFEAAIYAVMLELSHLVVKDGEGASKFIEVAVTGAEDDSAAKSIAMSIANSPLVKTAIAGGDANWGRVVMAAGKSMQAICQDKVEVCIGEQEVVKDGELVRDYSEQSASEHLQGQNIKLAFHAGVGSGVFTAWTCDLTKDYISINADYRS